MKRLTALAGALVLCLAGCGGDAENHSEPASPKAAAYLPEGCRPADVKNLIGGFLGAVNRGDRSAALRYVAPQPELIGVFFAIGRGADAKRIDARTPEAVYRAMRGIGAGERFHLLRAIVGPVGPFAHDTRYPELDSVVTAGVDFVLGVGSRSASGKAGIDCTSRRIYMMPVSVGRGLVPPRQQFCGGYVRLHASKPVVCAYPPD